MRKRSLVLLVAILFISFIGIHQSVEASNLRTETQFIKFFFTNGFNWGVTPSDLGGATLEPATDGDFYRYAPIPSYIIDKIIFEKLDNHNNSSDFIFNNNKLSDILIWIQKPNYGQWEELVLKEFGQPIVINRNGLHILTWTKDKYIMEYIENHNYNFISIWLGNRELSKIIPMINI